ncbi:MAG: hypothetical protein KJ583_02410 [Nanoarchaeota archaeon]|nr:hypothetical protein [Nanoarchaeota archaeon]MBU1269907.1 hypothetical protein [Nanoarchaeota archaeon]MBU1604148.1 hypothetical protein [Nanoarchaeota archaeon]MBU2443454.1 hypothetical protein [Nanoarchaeota archaeon]
MLQQDFKNIKTDTWHTIEYLGMPASKVNFVYVEREILEPEYATKIRKTTWLSKLEERKEALEKINSKNNYEIKFDEETKEDALFEVKTSKKKMWAGKTVTFVGLNLSEQKVDIFVHPISYTEWIACYNPEYAAAFKDKNLPLPYAGVGVSVLLESRDGLIPLTRRGIETPVYPGMLYSPGG